MAKKTLKTSIETIRRRDLVEAAYQTFLEHGLSGMTMARIGERAGMSHGIVNYYFTSKDALLNAVMRKANFLIMADTARRLRLATSPRARISAIILANVTEDLFTRDIARAWVSYYSAIGQNADFQRLQHIVDRRLISNLMHELRQLTTPDEARRTATNLGLLLEGLWLRRAGSNAEITARSAASVLEDYVTRAIHRGPDSAASP